MFSVGQKVECVDAKGGGRCLSKGQVFICTAVELNYLRVDCCANHSREEAGWFTTRFRPIQERKTDIAVFTEILRTATKRKPATVGAEP